MIIVKIGGGESINREGIIKGLTAIQEQFIIIHGANSFRDKISHKLNIEKKVITSVSGYSSVFTDENMIDMIMMAYSGYMNKRIVELCQQNGINAVGLTGLDGKLIQAKRNNGIRVKENNKLKILRDFSGKPKQLNSQLLTLLLENGYTPVLSIPLIDENNFAVNSENDDIAAVIKKEMNAGTVINFIEAPGFLKDKDDESSLVEKMTSAELERWEESSEGRMKRKLLALVKLFDGTKTKVIIADGRTDNPVENAMKGMGTVIE